MPPHRRRCAGVHSALLPAEARGTATAIGRRRGPGQLHEVHRLVDARSAHGRLPQQAASDAPRRSLSRGRARAQRGARAARRSSPGCGRCWRASVSTGRSIFVDDGSTRRHARQAARPCTRSDPRFKAISLSRNFGKEIAIAAGLQLRRRRRRRADGRRPAAPARTDPAVRRALARRLRHRLRPAHRPRRRQPPAPLVRARLLRRLREAERHHAARGRRRLPPARPQGRRRHEPHARARAGSTRACIAWMGFRSRRRAVPRAGAPDGGRSRWRPRQLLRFAHRRHRLVHDHPAAGVVLPRPADLVFRLLLCHGVPDQDAAVRHRRAGLPDPDHLGHVLCRRAAHLARRDRRIPGAHVRGGEGPAAVPGGRGAGRRAEPRGDRPRPSGAQDDGAPSSSSRSSTRAPAEGIVADA